MARAWSFSASALLFRAARLPKEFLELVFKLIGLEAPRSGSALLDNLAVLADKVQPVRKATVALGGRVLHVVDEHRHGEVELLRAGAGNLRALTQVLRIIDRTALRQGALAIDRMGLANVDDEEGSRLTILAVKFLQAPGLAGERWSCVAAKNQHHRLLVFMRRKADLASPIRLDEIRLRRALQQGKTEIRRHGTGAGQAPGMGCLPESCCRLNRLL